MSFSLKPLKEILKLTKEGYDEMMAPVRAKKVRASADVKVAGLEEKLITIERDVVELCSKPDIDFDKVLDKMDEYDLTERRVAQFKKVVADLFGDD